MSTISLRIPDSLHTYAKALAKEDGISVNQLITTALAEKMSALATETYLEERAKRGDRKAFENALANVADVDPEGEDRL
jgi:post-segregation antitoxin (ccd killing protein)